MSSVLFTTCLIICCVLWMHLCNFCLIFFFVQSSKVRPSQISKEGLELTSIVKTECPWIMQYSCNGISFSPPASRRIEEGTVFTGVCSHFGRGGVSPSGWQGWYPHLANGGYPHLAKRATPSGKQGYPHLANGGRYPIQLIAVPHHPGQVPGENR